MSRVWQGCYAGLNIMCLLASPRRYFTASDEAGLQIHLYNAALVRMELASSQPVTLKMSTDYPWQGPVAVTAAETDGSTWSLRLRVPDWAESAALTPNGQLDETVALESGYVVSERPWQTGKEVEMEKCIV